MTEIIWANQNISSTEKKEKHDPADLERIEQDRLMMKKVFIDLKVAEAKDSIKSTLADLNKKISWKTPEQISAFIDQGLETSIDLMEPSLKKIPEEIRNKILNVAIKSSEYLKSRAIDWNLDQKETDEIIQLQINDMMKSFDVK